MGAWTVLCTDKTGTLTENKVTLVKFVDITGNDDDKVLELSYINSFFETGLKSPLDGAILSFRATDTKGFDKLDEIPFDFVRKRVSVVVRKADETFLITKESSRRRC